MAPRPLEAVKVATTASGTVSPGSTCIRMVKVSVQEWSTGLATGPMTAGVTGFKSKVAATTSDASPISMVQGGERSAGSGFSVTEGGKQSNVPSSPCGGLTRI